MKLSDFKDEKAMDVIADLLGPIGRIASNPDNSVVKGKTRLDFARAILKNNGSDVKDMLAILNDVPPEDYHCNAATVFVNVMEMLNDPTLISLFGLRSEIPPSSGSASENTKGQSE